MAITGVVTRDAPAVADLAPGATAVDSIGTLLARNDVDLVVVVSPSGLHVDHVRAAPSRGCRLPNLGKIWATPNHPNHAQISLEDFVKIHPKSA